MISYALNLPAPSLRFGKVDVVTRLVRITVSICRDTDRTECLQRRFADTGQLLCCWWHSASVSSGYRPMSLFSALFWQWLARLASIGGILNSARKPLGQATTHAHWPIHHLHEMEDSCRSGKNRHAASQVSHWRR